VNDGVMLLFVLLHFECNSYAIRRFQIVRLCGHESPIFEKVDVSQAKSLVHFYSYLRTFEYLHDLQAKKAVPMVSCVNDLLVSVTWRYANSLSTEKGRAFCSFFLGSSFLKAQNCCNKRMLSSLSASFVGFYLHNDQKACSTLNMVPLTVSSASVLDLESENFPLLTTMANAPSKRIHSSLLRLSMKMSQPPTERQYSTHLAQVQDLLSCVPPIAACLWVSSTEAKSAKS
jgi:hypothetical protein